MFRNTPVVIENEATSSTVRIAIGGMGGSNLLISISARSVLLLALADELDTGNASGVGTREFLRVISLPTEVDPERVTASIHGEELMLVLPASTTIPALAQSL